MSITLPTPDISEWSTIDCQRWLALGADASLELFRQAVQRVPAYRKFLDEAGFDPANVKSLADWDRIPVTGKSTYLDRYSLGDLSWDGDPSRAAIVHASSGTTGEPYYWPCMAEELQNATAFYEAAFVHGFEILSRPTLLMICFGMGTWIAGSYTNAAGLLMRLKGLPITTVTPGFNRAEALKLLAKLGPAFDQVIIAGIPSFVKDLLEAWRLVRTESFKVRLYFAGESFPESWRSHVAGLAGGDPACDALAILGSADAGLIAFETPRTIELRQRLDQDRQACLQMFGEERVPAILQFQPTHRHIEAVDGRLVMSANRTVPLIRYDTLDRGGVLPSSALPGSDRPDWGGNLPLVYIFGRGKQSATLYGANIHAEHIQEFLVDPIVASVTSGRFLLETAYVDNFDQRLMVRVELAHGCDPRSAEIEHWPELFAAKLRKRSTEYSRICDEYGPGALPEFSLHPYGCPERFPAVQKKYS